MTAPGARAGLRGYGGFVVWTAGLTAAIAAALIAAGRFDLAGVRWARDVLGYTHFALAYAFTWRVVRRDLGSLRAALAYLACWAIAVAAYTAAHRWWLPLELDYVVLMVVFLIHHASNEVLFREQLGNGYQAFPWTARRIGWVALAVLLVLVDRPGHPDHPWHAGQRAIAVLWFAGWAAYGARWVWPARRSAGIAGWLAAGAFGAVCAWHPTQRLVFTSLFRFGWVVIYHYVAWYVFYLSKLMARHGGWAAQPAGRRPWEVVTGTPLGFLALVLIANGAIAVTYRLPPAPEWAMATASQVDWFHVNTIAHILFGAGVVRRQAAPAAARPRPGAEPLPQFA